MLNYLYALAEVECRLACIAVGLDPGLGVVHLDKAGRGSMVLDLLEALRPIVEAHALALAESRTWRRSDFHERPDGSVRLLMPSTHELGEVMPHLGREIAPFAEAVTHILATEVETKPN